MASAIDKQVAGKIAEAERKELHARIGSWTLERDFFGARVQQSSKAERKTIIEHRGKLSVTRYCHFPQLPHSTVYHRPRPEAVPDLELMRRIHELHLWSSHHFMHNPSDRYARRC